MTTTSTAAPSESANPATRYRREVTTMIKMLQEVLFSNREPVRNDRREFNGQLLDQNREDIYVQMYHQMGGIR